ncbi:hypothetical protein IKF12_01910 [Candidatus Saccharibacteria bacterium]|nr:hypothetical protein [Candidatus Saccharibacteria bacterium]
MDEKSIATPETKPSMAKTPQNKNGVIKINPKSIEDLEKQLGEYRKTHPEKTTEISAEIKRQKKVINKLYIQNKKLAHEFEKTNHEYLVFVRSTNGFYKLFDRSALFYYYNLAPKMEVIANIQPDNDFGEKSDIGFVSVKDLSKLNKKFQQFKISKIDTKDTTSNFAVFKLPWSFTDKQIVEFLEQESFAKRNFNHIVMTSDIIPVLHVNIVELTKAIYENSRKMQDAITRDSFGRRAINYAVEINSIYSNIANTKENKVSSLQNIEKNLVGLKIILKIVADLKIWNTRTVMRIADIIVKIQDIIELELRRINNGK